MKITRFSVTGWFSFSAISLEPRGVMGSEKLTVRRHSVAFFGVIITDESRKILEAVIRDNRGEQVFLSDGNLNDEEGQISFTAKHSIFGEPAKFTAMRHSTNGTYQGLWSWDVLSSGTTKMVIFELPESLYIGDIQKED